MKGASLPPADVRLRALARALDILVAFAPFLLLPRVREGAGLVLAAVLLVCADSLFGRGRSLGKRLFGLRTVVSATGEAAGLPRSLRRNAIFALALLPAAAPWVQPLVVAAVGLAAALAFEASLALRPLTRDLGRRRLGDLLAGTQVIDASIGLPLAAGLPAPLLRRAPSASAPRSKPLAARVRRKREGRLDHAQP